MTSSRLDLTDVPQIADEISYAITYNDASAEIEAAADLHIAAAKAAIKALHMEQKRGENPEAEAERQLRISERNRKKKWKRKNKTERVQRASRL